MEAVVASSGVEQGAGGGGSVVECLGDLTSRFGRLVAAVRRQGHWSYGFRLTGVCPSWVGFQCKGLPQLVMVLWPCRCGWARSGGDWVVGRRRWACFSGGLVD